MELQSPMEKFEQKKRRTNWIGLGLIAALLAAVIAVSSAQNEPNSDWYWAKTQRDEALAELQNFQQMQDEAQTFLEDLTGQTEKAREALRKRQELLGES